MWNLTADPALADVRAVCLGVHGCYTAVAHTLQRASRTCWLTNRPRPFPLNATLVQLAAPAVDALLPLIDGTNEIYSNLQQQESSARDPYGIDWGPIVAAICTNMTASQALLNR